MLKKKLQTAFKVLLAASLAGVATVEAYSNTPVTEQPKANNKVLKLDGKQKGIKPNVDQSRRQLRWKLDFDTKSGSDYAKQLEALGAILLIPTSEQDLYQTIWDLSKRPAKATIEDISKIDRIWFVSRDSKRIQLLMKELGLEEAPKNIVILLPKFIENEMLRKELAYSTRQAKDVDVTTFQFFSSQTGLDVKVMSQKAPDTPLK